MFIITTDVFFGSFVDKDTNQKNKKAKVHIIVSGKNKNKTNKKYQTKMALSKVHTSARIADVATLLLLNKHTSSLVDYHFWPHLTITLTLP